MCLLNVTRVSAAMGSAASSGRPSRTTKNAAVMIRAVIRLFSAGNGWNRAADRFRAGSGEGLVREDRFERVAQVVRSDVRPPLAQADVLIVDPTKVHDLSIG